MVVPYVFKIVLLHFTEMIVLSNGHNVALHIEQRIKKEVPFLSNVVLVGGGQDYVCCLVTLKVC